MSFWKKKKLQLLHCFHPSESLTDEDFCCFCLQRQYTYEFKSVPGHGRYMNQSVKEDHSQEICHAR